MIKTEQPSAFRLVRGLKTVSNWMHGHIHISARWQASRMGAWAQLYEELLAGKANGK